MNFLESVPCNDLPYFTRKIQQFLLYAFISHIRNTVTRKRNLKKFVLDLISKS